MASDEEGILRTQLQLLPPGTANYVAALVDLASHLNDKGQHEEAQQLYRTALLGGSYIDNSEAARDQQTRGAEPAAAPDTAADRDSDDWENGGWEADLERLTLAPTPPVQSRSGTDSSSGRKQEQRYTPPTGRKPDQQLFSAVRQSSSGRLRSLPSSPSRQSRSAQPSPSRQTNGHAAGRQEAAALRAPRGGSAASASAPEASASPPGLDWSDDEEPPTVVPFEGQHILELVGIKTTDKDKELLAYLMAFQTFAIRPHLVWADSSHALVVFSDVTAARLALASAPTIGRLWLKPYAQASPQCKQIAAKELQPPRLRPKTTDVVARRLVSNALQDPRLRDLAGERELREQRKERIANKARRRTELDAAWGD